MSHSGLKLPFSFHFAKTEKENGEPTHQGKGRITLNRKGADTFTSAIRAGTSSAKLFCTFGELSKRKETTESGDMSKRPKREPEPPMSEPIAESKTEAATSTILPATLTTPFMPQAATFPPFVYIALNDKTEKKITGVCSFDMDQSLFDSSKTHAQFLKTEKPEYYMMYPERVRTLLHTMKDLKIKCVITTSRYYHTETPANLFSIFNLLKQIVDNPGEFFEGVYFTNGHYKTDALNDLATKNQLEPHDMLHVDDTEDQIQACKDAGYPVALVSPESDAHLDIVDAWIKKISPAPVLPRGPR